MTSFLEEEVSRFIFDVLHENGKPFGEKSISISLGDYRDSRVLRLHVHVVF